MRTPNRQVELELRRNRSLATRFWSQVNCSDDVTACWEWTGRCHQGKPAFQVRGSSMAPARVTWLWSTGELPSGGRLYHSCSNDLCVRPSHLLWVVGRVMQQRLAAESDGYLCVSGQPLSLDVRPHYWPQVVRIPGANADHERESKVPRLRLGSRAMSPSSDGLAPMRPIDSLAV